MRKGVSDITNGLNDINKPSQPHEQFIIKFLINKHLVNCKFRSREHPNLFCCWHSDKQLSRGLKKVWIWGSTPSPQFGPAP